MPEPDVSQWRAIFDRMDSLLTLPADARDAAAPDAEGGDAVVDDVVRKWAAGTRSADLTADAVGSVAAVAQSLIGAAGVHNVQPGQRCGNYRLITAIGQGGMGSVWRAERVDGLYQSQVAVKLLGSLALSAQARARFAYEGELLARLAHPNIARLLDAGLTDDSQRFLVLELVEGRNILEHVQAQSSGGRAIALLFRQVLAAVAFAHSQLVVHRDIKPGNVMVTADGVVKLLDFGVGKLLDQAEQTAGAADLTRVVGAAYTEAYAAPEQLRGAPVSTAFDVFALGTLLFELLAGARPMWPSQKRYLQAHSRPDNLAAIVDPDLRAVVAKAIAVEADERYGTVAAFDEDIARYIAGDAVHAQPSTRAYRWRKFLLRHRWSVAAGTAAVVAVLASLGVALWQLHDARVQRAQALLEASRANEITTFVTGLFRASDPRTPLPQDRRQLTALQLLDAGRERLKTELDDHPETKIALLAVLAEVYGMMGDGARFVELNDERIRFATERLGPNHPAVLSAKFLDAEADLFSGNYDAARTTLAALREVFRTAFGDPSAKYAFFLATEADLERRARKESQRAVLQRFSDALSMFERLNIESEERAIAMQNYATALAQYGQMAESLAASDRAIAAFERLRDFDRISLVIAYDRRTLTLQQLGRHELVNAQYDKALELAEKSFGTHASIYLNTQLSKTLWLHGRGRRAEAWLLFDQVAAKPRMPISDSLGIHEQYFVRGSMLLDEGRFTEALSDLQKAVDGWAEAGNHPERLRRAQAALARAQLALQGKAGT